jgi:hypothetical protein
MREAPSLLTQSSRRVMNLLRWAISECHPGGLRHSRAVDVLGQETSMDRSVIMSPRGRVAGE